LIDKINNFVIIKAFAKSRNKVLYKTHKTSLSNDIKGLPCVVGTGRAVVVSGTSSVANFEVCFGGFSVAFVVASETFCGSVAFVVSIVTGFSVAFGFSVVMG
jgi:hypothetical protein